MTLTWFKLPIAAFMAETRRLSPEARGGYISLLCDYYENGPLPDSDIVLTTIVGCEDCDNFLLDEIKSLFTLRDGRWHHARADQEIAARSKAAAINASNAKNGGRKKNERTDTEMLEAIREARQTMPVTMARIEDDLTSAPKVETVTSYIGKPPEPIADPDDDDGEVAGDFSPIPLDFTIDGREVTRCQRAGATMEDISVWFDEWKTGHIERGTLSENWLAAWQARFETKVHAKLAANKPKPRVEVSKRK